MTDLSSFLDGVEAKAHSHPWHIFMPPTMARDEGATDPPSGMDAPVWCDRIGWAEESDVSPPHFVWFDGSTPE